MALTEPAGPVYVALDADLQEAELSALPPRIDWKRVGPGSPMGADDAALGSAVDLLVAAKRPLIVAGYAGRDPRAFDWIPELAEALGAGVIDMGTRLNIRTTHRLNVTGTTAIGEADVVVLLDMKDVSKALVSVESATRATTSMLAVDATLINIGFNDHQVSSWIQDVGPIHPIDLEITADTSVALPRLIERVKARLADESAARTAERGARRDALSDQHRERRASWKAIADKRRTAPTLPPCEYSCATATGTCSAATPTSTSS